MVRASKSNRLDLLDFYRGVAIVLVVLYHYTARYPNDYLRFSGNTWAVPFGHYGVQLFFAISGFCIAMTAESTRSGKVFLAKRFSRIYPAFVFAALITFLALRAVPVPGMTVAPKDLVGSWFFLGNQGFHWVDGAYWSLAVELRFYALFAIAYYRPRWMLPLLSCGAVLISIATVGLAFKGSLSLHTLASSPIVEAVNMLLIFEHIPWFLLGIGLYWLHIGSQERLARWLLAASILWIGALSVVEQEILGAYLGVVLAMGCVILLPKLRVPKSLTFVGAISYPLYLVHQNIGCMVIRETEALGSPTLRIAVAIAVSLILAVALHYGVEFRYRRKVETWVTVLLTAIQNQARLRKLVPIQSAVVDQVADPVATDGR